MNLLVLIFALFLIAHGLIHALYAAPAPPKDARRWPFQVKHSPILGPLGLDALAKPIGTVLWVLVVIGFTLAGLGLMGSPLLYEWWGILAVISAVLSLVLLVLFWDRQLVLGVVIDAAILVAVLWNQSPLYSYPAA